MMQEAKPVSFPNPERAENARKKLLEAALKIFSEIGYEAASTRNLAAAAGVNIAAIPYYFGSKEGLYLAMIDYIVDFYRQAIGGGIVKVKTALQNQNLTPAECWALLDDYMRLLIHFILQEGAERAQISRIYSREQLDPTSAFDRLYQGFTRDLYETLAALVARMIGPHLSLSEVKVIAQALIGQVTVFKYSRQAVLRDMSWETYGDKGISEIERIVMRNVSAIMSNYQDKSVIS